MPDILNNCMPEKCRDYFRIISYTREYLKEVQKCRKAFLEKGIDPRSNPHIRKIITDSWVKYHQTDKVKLQEQLNRDKFLVDNYLLMSSSEQIINSSASLLASYGHTVIVYNRESFVVNHSNWNYEHDVRTELSESRMGTSSHALAMQYNRTIQVLSYEHHLEQLKSVFAISAPICDESGTVIGAVTIKHIFPSYESIWEHNLNELQIHLAGWVQTLGMAIGIQLQLQKTYEVLETTFNNDRDEILSLDKRGTILCANTKICNFFQLPLQEVIGKNIAEFIGEESALLSSIRRWEKVEYIDETFRIKDRFANRLVCTQFGKSHLSDRPHIMILQLLNAKTVDVLSKRQTDSFAKIHFEDIQGDSIQMRKVKDRCRIFAKSPDNILITGESGTGKELFAQAIYNEYVRVVEDGGAFIALNCAAIPANLLESELFGYEGGAFTGADKKGRPGKIELAENGVLFLDEIGDMPYELQGVFLRVLQNREIFRIGGYRPKKVNFKLVAATNQPLLKMVNEKKFREDLYYRLSVLSVEIPPLRKHMEDLPTLVHYFMFRYTDLTGLPIPRFSESVLRFFNNYKWPGNIRQLENTVIFALNVAQNGTIDMSCLPQELQEENERLSVEGSSPVIEQSGLQKEGMTLKEIKEKESIIDALEKTNYNVANASKLFGVGKATLYRKMKKYQIQNK